MCTSSVAPIPQDQRNRQPRKPRKRTAEVDSSWPAASKPQRKPRRPYAPAVAKPPTARRRPGELPPPRSIVRGDKGKTARRGRNNKSLDSAPQFAGRDVGYDENFNPVLRKDLKRDRQMQNVRRKRALAIAEIAKKELRTVEEIEESVDLILQTATKRIAPGYGYSVLINQLFYEAKTAMDLAQNRDRAQDSAPSIASKIAAGAAEDVPVPVRSAGDSLDRLARVFDHVCEHGDPTRSQYSMMMSTYIAAKRPDDAMATYAKMVDDNYKPDTAALNLLMSTMLEFGFPEKAEKIWKSMLTSRKHPSPDDRTYAQIVAHYVKNDNLKKAEDMIVAMRATNKPGNAYVYAPVIKAMARQGDAISAQRMYATMRRDGVRPNQVVYNAMIEANARGGAHGQVVALLERMALENVPIGPGTGAALFTGYRQISPTKIENAVEVIDTAAELFTDFKAHPAMLCHVVDSAGEALDLARRGYGPGDPVAIESALGAFEAALDHGLRIDIDAKARLQLSMFKSRYGVTLALEHALARLNVSEARPKWEWKTNYYKKQPVDSEQGNSDDRTASADGANPGLLDIPDRGVLVFMNKNDPLMADRVSHILHGKFKPKIVARADPKNPTVLRLSKASVLRWARDKNRKGWSMGQGDRARTYTSPDDIAMAEGGPKHATSAAI